MEEQSGEWGSFDDLMARVGRSRYNIGKAIAAYGLEVEPKFMRVNGRNRFYNLAYADALRSYIDTLTKIPLPN